MDTYNRYVSISPLLKMPAEIREQIFSHMTGDKLVHMIFYDGTGDSIPAVPYAIRSRRNIAHISRWYLQRHLNTCPPSEPYRGFRYTVCIAHTSGDQVSKFYISRYKDRASLSSPSEYLTVPCRNCHPDCQQCGYDDECYAEAKINAASY